MTTAGTVATYAMDPDAQDVVIAGVRTRVHVTAPEDRTTPTLVMLHGGDVRSLSHATDFSTLWTTSPAVPRLLAFDKPGQGWSFDADALDRGLDPADIVEHLGAVVDRYCAGPVVLLGHSRGALPVMALTLARPELTVGVVLVSSNTLAPPSPLTPADFYPSMYRRGADEELSADYVGREAQGNSLRTDHVADLVEQRWRVARRPGWWESHAERTRLHDEVLRPRLDRMRDDLIARLGTERLDLPSLTVWGADDVSAPEALAPALLDVVRPAFASADYVALSGARHYVYRDRASSFRNHLEAWLDTVPGWGRR